MRESEMSNIVKFKVGSRREEDICQLSGGGQKYFGDSEEVELFHCLISLLGMGIAEERVPTLDVHHPDGIGFSCEDGLHNHLRRDKAHHGGKTKFRAQNLFFFVRKLLNLNHFPWPHDKWPRSIYISSLHLQVSSESHQNQ